jgi:hypothetical protein
MARNVVVAIALVLALVHLGRVDEIAAGSDFKPSPGYKKARYKLLGWSSKKTPLSFYGTKSRLHLMLKELSDAKSQGLEMGE